MALDLLRCVTRGGWVVKWANLGVTYLLNSL